MDATMDLGSVPLDALAGELESRGMLTLAPLESRGMLTLAPLPLHKMRRLRAASKTLSDDEARFLVDSYYSMQKQRITASHQIRALTESEEPHDVLAWLFSQSRTLEKEVARALDTYSKESELGQWARRFKGVGPVIAAGLLAHLRFEIPDKETGEIKRIATPSAFWSFAGLDPTAEWKKGKKRPWNASLKTLCWKLGESFVKVSGYEDAFFGKLYRDRKQYEVERNEAGDYAGQAASKLERFKIGKTTDAYKAYSKGKLPPAHVHQRACRWAVKMFLSCYHRKGYLLKFGEEPPQPYAISILGHADYVCPE